MMYKHAPTTKHQAKVNVGVRDHLSDIAEVSLFYLLDAWELMLTITTIMRRKDPGKTAMMTDFFLFTMSILHNACLQNTWAAGSMTPHLLALAFLLLLLLT